MHAIIHKKGSNDIKYVIKNCIKRGGYFVGDNCKIHVNLKFFDVVWTDDDVNPIMDKDGLTPIMDKDGLDIAGWDKNVSDLAPSTDVGEIIAPTRNEIREAIRLRRVIDNMTYQGLNDYIETNVVDLASAKVFIKTLAKVTLALCKLIDSK